MSKDFWNSLTKRNKTTGYSDFSIACFDQEMRLGCVNNLLKKHNALIPDCRVLDFGCGNGDFVFRLASKAAQLIGYDLSNEVISLAQKRSTQIQNVTFTSNLQEITSTFDIVLSITVLQHIMDDDELLSTIKKIS